MSSFVNMSNIFILNSAIKAEQEKNQISILIVDDEDGIRTPICKYLKHAGYNAYTATDAKESLEILKKDKFDVVITDISMKGMSGLELSDLIKKTYDTDIILMTGYYEEYSYEDAINKGASDFVFKPVRFEELLLRLKRVLKERQLRKERTIILKKLKKLAMTDDLTKLFNSRYFYHQIELEINRANRYNHPLGLLLFDIDYFKKYNDSFGHLEGNKVLARLGQTTKSLLRKMDSAYRYGGEEFTVILPETNADKAKIAAHRLKVAMEAETFSPVQGKSVGITISIGVTQYVPNEELADFIQRADKAMYISKKKGRNRVYSLLS